MTDAQKVKLIKAILCDYYEAGGSESGSADVLIGVIDRIVDMEPDEKK